ncbi:hypothetical protein Pmani_013157 [Petrolisthes manimaculis]|uniref:Myb/SANT-like DNA-binding domain-containing protein n=1 Tax=Petrolisthes manimaculis TaxID=1843537 RepID=A0AAE1PWA5_9EUCA|nr:hypothetical protein Pmani_013157 [Petrolisthes manimaculis]
MSTGKVYQVWSSEMVQCLLSKIKLLWPNFHHHHDDHGKKYTMKTLYQDASSHMCKCGFPMTPYRVEKKWHNLVTTYRNILSKTKNINADDDTDGKKNINEEDDTDGKKNINTDDDTDGKKNINTDDDTDGEKNINTDGKKNIINADDDTDSKRNNNRIAAASASLGDDPLVAAARKHDYFEELHEIMGNMKTVRAKPNHNTQQQQQQPPLSPPPLLTTSPSPEPRQKRFKMEDVRLQTPQIILRKRYPSIRQGEGGEAVPAQMT